MKTEKELKTELKRLEKMLEEKMKNGWAVEDNPKVRQASIEIEVLKWILQ